MNPQYAAQASNPEVLAWVNTALAAHLKKNEENMSEVEHVLDYLNSDAAPARLRKMSYKQAKAAAEKWNAALVKKGKNIREDEADVETFIDFGDGFRFVKLVGQSAFQREGSLMGHCVASYYGRNCEIYSLRDADNMPHCTIEKNGGIEQIKGKGNGHIHPRYVAYVVKFLEQVGMRIREGEMAHLGYVLASKAYLHAAGLVYERVPTFDFNDKTWLYIYGSTKVRPYDKAKLSVAIKKLDGGALEQSLRANQLELAKVMIAAGMKVGGSLYLRGTAITALPENLSVGGSLDLQGTAITALPENLSVGGWLYLQGTAIGSVPKSAKIKGRVWR
jgi:hypothetical protein